MKLVTRSGWNARPFTCSQPVPAIDGFVVHYTASGADIQADHANCPARVRGIQNYHMDTKGWCDIAYNFVFCKHGVVFEGRGWSRKAGATGEDNAHTVAFCFLGDDTAGQDDVTADGRASLTELIQVGAVRYPGEQTVKGHRDYMQTSCPGDELEAWVKARGWETHQPRRVRFELWAKLYGKVVLIDHSIPVLPGEGRLKIRAAKFIARVAPEMASLAVRGALPRIRRAVV